MIDTNNLELHRSEILRLTSENTELRERCEEAEKAARRTWAAVGTIEVADKLAGLLGMDDRAAIQILRFLEDEFAAQVVDDPLIIFPAERDAMAERLTRTEKELAIRKSGTERWLPCADHRDKVDYRNACPECYRARADEEFKRLRAEASSLDPILARWFCERLDAARARMGGGA